MTDTCGTSLYMLYDGGFSARIAGGGSHHVWNLSFLLENRKMTNDPTSRHLKMSYPKD